MEKHKIKLTHNSTKYDFPVVRALCVCGWNSPWYNESYEFVGMCLKDDMLEHLGDVGIIEKPR